MTSNWQLPNWPKFIYDVDRITQKERQFLKGLGCSCVLLRNISNKERNLFKVEILSIEGIESSKIEGEFLERESLQSSIRKCFGLQADIKLRRPKESGMAELLHKVHETFAAPLTHEMLCEWHSALFKNWSTLSDYGKYRSHIEPMQIVSNRLDGQKVFFEAPPSEEILEQMTLFINWFNSNTRSESILGRAAIAHIYFESIHPFEDGNGRIGRVLSEKMLAQCVGQPLLIAVSRCIEKNKKQYYTELEKCNRTLNVSDWVAFFSDMILKAQSDSMQWLQFIIDKAKILSKVTGQINPRQEKILLRMFLEGPDGFTGGISAEKYIGITGSSRATATRDLSDLVEKEALKKTGELRHTRYWLNISERSAYDE